MPLLSLLLACGGPTGDSAAAGPNGPEVYLLSPADGSSWEPLALIPVTGVLVDDGTPADALTVEIRSDRDGVVGTPSLTADGQLSTTLSLSEGPHTLTVSAADAAGHTATRTVGISVVPADRPSQPAFRVDPEAPVTGDPLLATLVVEAIDPAGAPLTYVWAWSVDGTETELTDVAVPADRVHAGETWTATVFATNGTTPSTALSRSVTVGNAPPTVDGVHLEPAEADATTALRCAADAPQDREGDPFTAAWAWERDGVALDEVGPVLAAGTALRGQQVRCGLSLSDAAGPVGTTWSAPLTVSDTAPTLTEVAIEPASGDVTTSFRCRPHGAVDLDHDAVQFTTTWYADDSPVGGEAVLPAGTPHDTRLSCVVVPSDGEQAGTAVRSEVLVVGNSAPGAPAVVALGDVTVGQPAGCGVVEAPVDPDGDPVELTWTWEVDGAVLPADGPEVATTGLAPGAVLACTATPDDGRTLGVAGTATLSLLPPTRGTLGTGEARVLIEGSTPAGQFGKVVDDVPDLDGDGLRELLVGAPRGDGGTRGAVYLFTSGTLATPGRFGDTDADAAWYGHAAGDLLTNGRGAAGSEDVDGDGVPDLLAGAPPADAGAVDAGEVYLISGARVDGAWGADVAGVAVARFRGAAGDQLGIRMAGGDLDGDGVAEVVAAAPYRDTAGDKSGSVLIWFGGAGLGGGTFAASGADAEITGRHPGDQLGWSLAIGADGNGDGYPELLTGAFQDDTNAVDAGAAAVISGDRLDGRADFDTAGWLVVYGTGAGDHLGYDAAAVGDVDADGLGDVAFGAYLADGVGADAGLATLWFGRAGLNRVVDAGSADTTWRGAAAGDLLGGVLEAAGDFDADGRADLLFGLPRADTAEGEVGAAFLVLGADLGRGGAQHTPDSAALSVLGPAPGALLGDELAGGLDLDDDGFQELVIAGQGAEGAEAGSGVVWIFEGP